jgi:hypothetical protein
MKDSTSRISEIETRIEWLRTELVHENYYPGGIVVGFREELTRLIHELDTLRGKK